MTEQQQEHPFYGSWILRERQQEYILALLGKYQTEPVSDELRKKVYNELMMEKYHGRITIPFRVVMRRDVYGKYPERIEIILDSKV